MAYVKKTKDVCFIQVWNKEYHCWDDLYDCESYKEAIKCLYEERLGDKENSYQIKCKRVKIEEK